MAEFSEFLYELRKEKNLTQSELAERLGITNKAVSKWETGDAMPDTSQLLPLAEIFGVSVDELLRGRRNSDPEQNREQQTEDSEESGDHIRFSNGKDTVEVSSKGVFINGEKAVRSQSTVLEKISGCVCASLVALGVIVYVALGCYYGLWHPLWCIPVSSALGCGIVGCVFDLCDRVKRERKWKKGENPYTAAVCGIVMCASLIVFLCTAAVCNLWHIMWISPVAGVCACIVIGALGAVFNRKSGK